MKSPDSESFEVQLNQTWADAHPLTEFSLRKEAAEWERIGYRYSIRLSE